MPPPREPPTWEDSPVQDEFEEDWSQQASGGGRWSVAAGVAASMAAGNAASHRGSWNTRSAVSPTGGRQQGRRGQQRAPPPDPSELAAPPTPIGAPAPLPPPHAGVQQSRGVAFEDEDDGDAAKDWGFRAAGSWEDVAGPPPTVLAGGGAKAKGKKGSAEGAQAPGASGSASPGGAEEGEGRFSNQRFRPRKLCMYYAGPGTCRKGEACQFAHSVAELHPDIAPQRTGAAAAPQPVAPGMQPPSAAPQPTQQPQPQQQPQQQQPKQVAASGGGQAAASSPAVTAVPPQSAAPPPSSIASEGSELLARLLQEVQSERFRSFGAQPREAGDGAQPPPQQQQSER